LKVFLITGKRELRVKCIGHASQPYLGCSFDLLDLGEVGFEWKYNLENYMYFHFQSFKENVNVSAHCIFFCAYRSLPIELILNKKKAKEIGVKILV